MDVAKAPDAALAVLEALDSEPDLSQRQLARRVGLSVTQAHFVVKRLVERGLVKVQNVTKSRHKLGYLYVLTPAGVAAKARLTYRFLVKTATDYTNMVERFGKVLAPALQAASANNDGAPVGVQVLGQGPVADVVRALVKSDPCALLSNEESAQLVVVVDPEARVMAKAPLLHLLWQDDGRAASSGAKPSHRGQPRRGAS